MEDQNQGLLMRELSDIKSALAVNTSETANIKATVGEIKMDVREIKNDFITRREANEKDTERMKEINAKIDPLKRIVYGTVGIVGAAIVGGLIKLVLK